MKKRNAVDQDGFEIKEHLCVINDGLDINICVYLTSKEQISFFKILPSDCLDTENQSDIG